MNGNSIILDTNILIYLSKGHKQIMPLISKYKHIYISVVTQMEILGFTFENPEEKILVEKLVSFFEIIHTDTEIAEAVIRYRKKKKIKLPDAIILATAKKMKADLLTANVTDFNNIDLSVKIIPFL